MHSANNNKKKLDFLLCWSLSETHKFAYFVLFLSYISKFILDNSFKFACKTFNMLLSFYVHHDLYVRCTNGNKKEDEKNDKYAAWRKKKFFFFLLDYDRKSFHALL